MNPFENRILNLTLQQYKSDIALQKILKQGKKVIPDDDNFKVYPRTPQAIVQKNATDLMMNDIINDIQIQTMLKNAVPQYRPKKIQSEVTEEMIKDYQQESKKPVEINGKLYKFVPPDLDLDLEEPDPNIIINLPSKEEFNRNSDEFLRRKIADRDRNYTDLLNLRLRIEKINKDFDDGGMSYANWASEKTDLEREVELTIATIKSLDNEISNVPNIRKHYDELDSANKAELDRVDIINKKKIASYEEALRLRNTGQEVAQQPGESDEDYAQRMIDIGHETLDPEDVKLDAQLYLYNNLKDKFGEFMEPYKVEWVLNTLVQQEGYEFLQKLKDRWPAVSKKIKETFGTLRRVDQETTIDFLTTEVFEPEKPRSEKERALPNVSTLTERTTFEKPRPERELPNVSTLTERRTFTEMPRQRGRSSRISDLTESTQSLSGLKNRMSSRGRARSSSNISALTEPDYEPEKINWMDFLSPESRLSLTESPSSQRALSSSTPIRDSGSMVPQERTKYKKELVAYCEQHDYKGVNGGAPKNMNIQALEKLIQSKRPLSGEGIDPLKTRFEIVDGSIQAGNNNPKLIREVRKLLKEMVAKKMVNLYEAKSHMNYLKKVIKI
jgi:hypothetical protein